MDVVTRVCDLPVQFKARGTVSVLDLVDESGYRADPASLTVDAVCAHLRGHPDLVDAWLAYSEDKRTSAGWYVTQRSGDTFEVGHYPEGDRISVTGPVSACAEFIVREVRSITC